METELCVQDLHPPLTPWSGHSSLQRDSAGIIMPKGRLYNPPTERHGIWFPHIDVNIKLPTTSTQDMYHQANTEPRKQQRLPHVCTTWNKNEVQKDYPFSSHDNRHVIQSMGEYLNSDLGRKKAPIEQRQHTSQNLNLSNHETPQRPITDWNVYSNYQVSYMGSQGTEWPFCRRYLKHHHNWSAYKKDLPENNYMWFANYRIVPHRCCPSNVRPKKGTDEPVDVL
ncbi:testis-expressed protein 36 [Mixophyes fleayi]|uniref:testis-expressed protein 36 n=1 Tax=Mixophyes fleayi TaxID=3061075 RepID=UPI003F4E2E5C